MDKEVKAIFMASTSIKIGNGKSFSFWHDHWLHGEIPSVSFPLLYKHCNRRQITVSEGLTDNLWIRLIKRNPDEAVLREFVDLWHRLQSFNVSELEDEVCWKWTAMELIAHNLHTIYSFMAESALLS